MTTFAQEFLKAVKETPRLYFAPTIGAIRGAIRGAMEEYDRVKAQSDAANQPTAKAAK